MNRIALLACYHLLQRNTLNLDRHALGQLGHGDAAAGGLVDEELFVGGIHFGEVGHVGDEDLSIALLAYHITFLSAGNSSPSAPPPHHPPTSRNPQRKREREGRTYINLNNLLNARPGGRQDSPDIVAARLGLVADGALDQVRRGVRGDLAGHEDLAVGADGLGLFHHHQHQQYSGLGWVGETYVGTRGCRERWLVDVVRMMGGDIRGQASFAETEVIDMVCSL